MRRTLPFLIAMVMSTLGWVVAAPTAAGATHEQPPVTDTYDAPAYDGPVAGAVSERGPPAPRDRCTTYDAADLRSHGISACSGETTTPAVYNYDDPARFVRTSRGSQGVDESAGGRAADYVVQRLRAAAEAGAARFTVNSAGEATMSIRAGSTSLEVSEHAASRMTQRGISIDAAEATLTRQPFPYFHQGPGRLASTTQLPGSSSVP